MRGRSYDPFERRTQGYELRGGDNPLYIRFVPHFCCMGLWGCLSLTAPQRGGALVELEATGAGPDELQQNTKSTAHNAHAHVHGKLCIGAESGRRTA